LNPLSHWTKEERRRSVEKTRRLARFIHDLRISGVSPQVIEQTIRVIRDTLGVMLAGATAVGIGTALFVDPTTPLKVLAGLDVLVSLSGGSVRYEAMMCGVPDAVVDGEFDRQSIRQTQAQPVGMPVRPEAQFVQAFQAESEPARAAALFVLDDVLIAGLVIIQVDRIDRGAFLSGDLQ
jgi:hypothetical protein